MYNGLLIRTAVAPRGIKWEGDALRQCDDEVDLMMLYYVSHQSRRSGSGAAGVAGVALLMGAGIPAWPRFLVGMDNHAYPGIVSTELHRSQSAHAGGTLGLYVPFR